LYRAISSNRGTAVEVRFCDEETAVAVVKGFVTKFDTDHFAPEPAITMSVYCEDPMLRAPTPTVVNVAALTDKITLVDNVSTAPHGFIAKFTTPTATSSFEIRDAENPVDATWKFTVTPPGGFEVNDELYLSSVVGDRYFYIVRSSAIQHYASHIEPGSVWPLLFPGPNDFFITPTDIVWDELNHYPTYWGV
jgi:hypothetical protein